jgi:hypothetical protein
MIKKIRKHKFDKTAISVFVVALVMLCSGIVSLIPHNTYNKGKGTDGNKTPSAVIAAQDDYASKTGEYYKYIPYPGEGNTGGIRLAQRTDTNTGTVIATDMSITQEQHSGLTGWLGKEKQDISQLKDAADKNSRKPVYSKEDLEGIAAKNTASVPVVLLENDYQFVLLELTQLAYFKITDFINPQGGSTMKPSGWIKYNGSYLNPAKIPTPPSAEEGGDTTNMDGKMGMGFYAVQKTELEARGAKTELDYKNYVWSPYMNYVAYNEVNSPTVRAMFNQEGLYEFHLPVAVDNGVYQQLTLDFSFYIVIKSNYVNQPYLPSTYRVTSAGTETYSYVFHGERPFIRYEKTRYDIEDILGEDGLSVFSTGVSTADGKYKKTSLEDPILYPNRNEDPNKDINRYDFSTVGRYTIKSIMIYTYIDPTTGEKTVVDLQRYTGYTIVLSIYGFQPYYGRIMEIPDTYNPDKMVETSVMTPFWDDEGKNGSADITTEAGLLTQDTLDALRQNGTITTTEYTRLLRNVTTAATSNEYLQALTSYLDKTKQIIPVVTNCPPVQLSGNVDFAVGNDKIILSAVAFHSAADYNQGKKVWQYSSLTVGKPFSDPGEYVITLYFNASNKLQRQVFYFQISNVTEILFDLQDGKTPYSFADVLYQMNGKIETGRPIVVTFPSNPLGAYQVAPIFELTFRQEFNPQLSSGSLEIGEYLQNESGDMWSGKITNNHYWYELQGGTKQLTIGGRGMIDTNNNGISDTDGEYTFNVSYGAFRQASSVIKVVLDTSGAGIVKATASNTPTGDAYRYRLLIPEETNTAVFGIKATEHNDNPNNDGITPAEGISLSWGVGYDDDGFTYSLKPSGIGFPAKGAIVEYWQFSTNLVDANAYSNTTPPGQLPSYYYQQSAFYKSLKSDLFSMSNFSYWNAPDYGVPTRTTPIDGNIVRTTINGTQVGWKIDTPFIEPGLYRIKITDEVNITTEFILLIDDSTPAYTQSVLPEGAKTKVNIIDYDPFEGVEVAFGKWKIVTTDAYDKANINQSALYDADQFLVVDGVATTIPNPKYNPRGLIFNDEVYAPLKNPQYGGAQYSTSKGQRSIFGSTAARGLLVDSYSVPIIKAEIMKDGEAYVQGGDGFGENEGYPTGAIMNTYKQFGSFYEDNKDAKEKGYFLLRAVDKNNNGAIDEEEDIEGTYKMRITDALQNITEMYIILSHDKSMGTAFGDSIANVGPTENASLVDVKGGLTNRDFVTFSFYQPGINTAANYFVSYLEVFFYPFDWLQYDDTGINKNYPFVLPAVPPATNLMGRWLYNSSGSIIGENDERVYSVTPSPNVKFLASSGGSLLTGQETKYIQFFPDTTTGTEKGIYQIVRHYGQPQGAGNPVFPGSSPEYDKKVREYYFIVDDTGMLSYSDNFYQTELKVKFGDRPDDIIYRNLAEAKDFNEKRNVLESNLEATVRGTAGKFRLNPTGVVENLPLVPNTYDLHTETYSWTVNGIIQKGEIKASHYFSSLVPRYLIDNDKMSYVDAGRGTEMYPKWARLGKQSSDVNYNLLIRDGSEAFYYLQTASRSGEIPTKDGEVISPEEAKDPSTLKDPTSANHGVLKMRIDVRSGSKGDFLLNGVGGGRPNEQNKIVSGPIEGSTVVYSNNTAGTRPVYTTIMNPNNLKSTDVLTFEFQNNPQSFISSIIPETFGNYFWTKANGPSMNLKDLTETRPGNFRDTGAEISGIQLYRYNMTYWDNTENSPSNSYNNTDRFTVTLTTVDGIVTKFVLVMDTEPPIYNLVEREYSIKDMDTIAKDVDYSVLVNTPTYIYGLSNSFDFINRYRVEENEDYYFGVRDVVGQNGITFAKIESAADLSTGETIEFNINANEPFSLMQRVGLDNGEPETQYYLITETDFAGNRTQYIIQLKSEVFNDAITFEGALPSVAGDTRVFGKNMTVGNILEFWNANSSFRIECDANNWYYVFDKTATWMVNGTQSSALKDSAKFKEILNTWIAQYAQSEKMIEFKILDRFGTQKVISFYNINDSTEQVQLNAYYTGPTVNVETTNYNRLPDILKDPTLADRYTLEVWEILGVSADGRQEASAVMSPNRSDMNLPADIQTLNGFVNSPLDKTLLIKLTDPFERTTYTEYYGQNETVFELKYYGNTVEVRGDGTVGNKIMVGDKRGVEFRYSEEYFKPEIHIYPNGKYSNNTEKVIFTDIPPAVNGVMYIQFTPETINPQTGAPIGDALIEIITRGTLEVPGTGASAILHHDFFEFNTKLPLLSFATLDNPDSILDPSVKEVFDGTIMYIDKENSPYGGSVSFTRTHNGITDRFTIPSWMDSYTLANPGVYKITVRNSLWAEGTYDMEVVETSTSVLELFDTIGGELVQLSPSSVSYSLNVASIYNAASTNAFTPETITHLDISTQNVAQYVFSFEKQITDYYLAVEAVESEGIAGQAGIENIYNDAELLKTGLDFYAIEAQGRELVREQPIVEVPPINNRQIIGMKVGSYYTKNNYFYMPPQTRTLVWCLARPIYDANRNIVDFASPIWFVTTGVNESKPLSNTVGVKLVDIGTGVTLNYAGEQYRLYTPTMMKPSAGAELSTGFPQAGIKVGIQYEGNKQYNPTTGQTANNSNVLRMKYYKDGVYMGDITGTSSLVIMPEDAGRFDFYVYDMVGNFAQFGPDAKGQFIDHYTLVNLSKPFAIINSAIPVSGAVYNDLVSLYITDVQYALELFGQEYYNNYFYISNFTVFLDGVEQTRYSIPAADRETGEVPLLESTKHNTNRFTFTASGRYEINVRYRIGAALFVQNTYTFQIVPSVLPIEQFEYVIVPNIKITKITRNNYNISNNYNLETYSKISFSVNDGVGEYAVFGETVADTINRSVPLNFKVSIDRKNSSSSIWVEGVASGASTSTPVTVNYYPYYLYNDGLQRPVTVIVYNNGLVVADKTNNYPVVINDVTINQLRTGGQRQGEAESLEYQNTVTTASFSEEGLYVVVAFDADNDVMFTYSFSIASVKSRRGIVVGSILGGVLLIMIFIFIRIRAKMKVK